MLVCLKRSQSEEDKSHHDPTLYTVLSYYRLATAIQATDSEESVQLLPDDILCCLENTSPNQCYQVKGIRHTHFQS